MYNLGHATLKEYMKEKEKMSCDATYFCIFCCYANKMFGLVGWLVVCKLASWKRILIGLSDKHIIQIYHLSHLHYINGPPYLILILPHNIEFLIKFLFCIQIKLWLYSMMRKFKIMIWIKLCPTNNSVGSSKGVTGVLAIFFPKA